MPADDATQHSGRREAVLREMDVATLRSVRAIRMELLSVTRARAYGAWARRWLALAPSTRRRLQACACLAVVALPSQGMRVCFMLLHASLLSVLCNLLWWLLDTRQQLRLAEGRHTLESSSAR